MLEVVPQRVGFRKIELKKELGQVWVNGQPVLFKGADRHELDPLTGYQAVSYTHLDVYKRQWQGFALERWDIDPKEKRGTDI